MLEDKKLELEGMLMTVGDIPTRNGASARLAKAPDKAAASSDAPNGVSKSFSVKQKKAPAN